MLTAKQARDLRSSMQKSEVDVVIRDILKDIAEQALEASARTHVYADLKFCDEKVDYVVNVLTNLGYSVDVSKYPEDKCTSITVEF